MAMVLLKSVGCVFDTETRMTYPCDEEGTPDLYEGSAIHIDDCTEEWLNAMSPLEREAVTSKARRMFGDSQLTRDIEKDNA